MIQMKRKLTKLNTALYIRCNVTRHKNVDRIEHYESYKFNLLEKFSHLNDSSKFCVFLDQGESGG